MGVGPLRPDDLKNDPAKLGGVLFQILGMIENGADSERVCQLERIMSGGGMG